MSECSRITLKCNDTSHTLKANGIKIRIRGSLRTCWNRGVLGSPSAPVLCPTTGEGRWGGFQSSRGCWLLFVVWKCKKCLENILIGKYPSWSISFKTAIKWLMSWWHYTLLWKVLLSINNTPVFCSPSFDKAHPDGAHPCQLINRLKTLVDRLGQQGCKLLIVEYLQITSCDKNYVYQVNSVL